MARPSDIDGRIAINARQALTVESLIAHSTQTTGSGHPNAPRPDSGHRSGGCFSCADLAAALSFDMLAPDGAPVADAALNGIEARPIDAADLPVLREVYASARAEEIAATGWTEAEQREFLDQQFDLQHRYYQEHYADAHFLLLLRQREPVGRLYLFSQSERLTLIDLSLLPEARGGGIGSAIMAVLVATADRTMRSMALHVEPSNPAQRLYRRVGFEVVADNSVYLKMNRSPRPVRQ